MTRDESRPAARGQTDRDTTGCIVVAQGARQPRDRTERIAQLRDDERQRDRDEGELDGESHREDPKDVGERVASPGREGHHRKEEGEQGEYGDCEPRGATEQPPIGEARRDKPTHVGRVGVLDPLQPFVRGFSDVREAREHLAFEVDDERVIVGIPRVVERRRRIELVSGFHPHDPHPAARVDLEDARQRDGPSVGAEDLDRAGVVRERGVTDPRQCDDPALRSFEERVERSREPRMRDERGVGIGATFSEHVERVAGEHDHGRPAARLDRVRDRPGDLARHIGSARNQPQTPEHEHLAATGDRERLLVDDRRPAGREVDELGAGYLRRRFVIGPVLHRHRPQSSAFPRPYLVQPSKAAPTRYL